MSDRVLIAKKDGKEIKVAIDRDRFFIGRDKKCDLSLDDSSVSRKHAAVIHKFGVIYIENISSTGQILKDGNPVEFCELAEGQSIEIGPFSISWAVESNRSRGELDAAVAGEGSSRNRASEEQRVGPDIAEERELEGISGGEAVPAPGEAGPPAEAPVEEQAPIDEFNMGGNDLDVAPAMGSSVAVAPQSPGDSGMNAESGNDATNVGELDSNAGTQVLHQNLAATLKVVKGEANVREINLGEGLSWTVGRGPKNDIPVDNNKLSRQHFKIVRLGKAFRVQDLGSANGTRLNGVSVTDAPLNSFDTIQAGPVEMQFLVTDPRASGQTHVGPMMGSGTGINALDILGGNGLGMDSNTSQKTVFGIPSAPPGLSTGTNALMPRGGFGNNNHFNRPLGSNDPFAGGVAMGMAQPTGTESASGGGFVEWFKEQPTPRKIMYPGAIVLILLVVFMQGQPASQGEPSALVDAASNAVSNPNSRTPASSTSGAGVASTNAADPRQISEEFSKLSPAKQREIEDLYVKAEAAQRDKNWKLAWESTKTIMTYIKRYKKALEIMDQAQTALNEEQLGNISQTRNNVKDAASDNAEKIEIFLKNGDKALSESRWDDAAESYLKALNLDPTNTSATQGYARALAKNPNVTAEVPNAPAVVDENAAEKQRELEAIDSLKGMYQDARSKMNNGAFGQALGILKQLDSDVKEKMSDYNSGRAPASIRDEAMGEAKRLQTRVRELMDTAKTQLVAEYQTQLADAEEFTNNRQYIQAREIYDRILRLEPAFDEPREAQGRLYAKILTEAKNLYQEALIYESVGDLSLAIEGFQKSRDLLTNVNDSTATEYYKRAAQKLKRLQK